MQNLRRVWRELDLDASPKWVILLLSAAVLFAQPAYAKAVGTVKSISGNTIVLTTDAGTDASVTLSDSTRLVRISPGQTDLKSATPIQLSDVQVGDRVLALGPDGEGSSTAASMVVVMKKTDIAGKQQQEREEWRNGVGGIVKQVDPSSGTITIANTFAASGKPILVHVSSATVVRRYPPDSANYSDAKPGTLDEIQPGDQLQARGTKNADGTELTAQEIVSGAFRQIAGTVISTDPAQNSLTLMDLTTKKPVTVKINASSQMHQLPQLFAQRLAMRFKGGTPGEVTARTSGGASQNATSGNWNGVAGSGSWRGRGGVDAGGNGEGGMGMRAGGAPDFDRILSRMPTVSLSDLQKGEAVIVAATQGSATSPPTATKLITGVEPILSAAPSGAAAATILSPWNLGGAPAGAEAPE
jgi:hypothetical protein